MTKIIGATSMLENETFYPGAYGVMSHESTIGLLNTLSSAYKIKEMSNASLKLLAEDLGARFHSYTSFIVARAEFKQK